MEEQVSIKMLRQRAEAKIKELGKCGMSVSGSFVRTSRKCGKPDCRCADGSGKHPCCLLTSKVAGKTKSVYVPVDMEEEVEKWAREHKRVKRLLAEIDALAVEMIKRRASARRAASKNLALLSRSPPTS